MSGNRPEDKIGGPSQGVFIAPFNPLGDHESRILDTATVYSPGDQPKNAMFILVQAITANIRFTLDGSDPTATVGFQIVAGDPAVIIPLAKNTVLNFIAEAANAVLQYQWGE